MWRSKCSGHISYSTNIIIIISSSFQIFFEQYVVFLSQYLIFFFFLRNNEHLNHYFFLGAHLQIDEKWFIPTFYKIQCLSGASTGKEKGIGSLWPLMFSVIIIWNSYLPGAQGIGQMVSEHTLTPSPKPLHFVRVI